MTSAPLTPAQQATRGAALVAAYAGFTHAVAVTDWGLGWARGLLVLGATLLLAWRGFPTPLPAARTHHRALGVALVFTSLFRLVQLHPSVEPPRPLDIATTTLAAQDALLVGRNPYSVPLDVRPESTSHEGGTGFYDGYKYGVLSAVIYAPLGIPLGAWGINATNLLFMFIIAALLWRLSRAMGAPHEAPGLLGALLWMLTVYAWREQAVKGVNDGVALALVLGALLARHEKRPAACGALLGASLACKVLPGAAALLVLAWGPGWWTVLGWAVAVPVLLHAPFAWDAPRELLANLFLFNASRPADSTGLAGMLPEVMRSPFRVLVLLGVAWTVAQHARRRLFDPATQLRTLGVVLGLVMLSSSIHRNYTLWVLPAWALAVAHAVYGRGEQRRG